jgi:hypothetical protein
MRNIIKNFLMILKVEIEDLAADIELLLAENQRKKEAGTITDYVFSWKIKPFSARFTGVQSFNRILEQTDPAGFTTLTI